MKDLNGLKTEEDLDIYLRNYNWDDGFEIPIAILQKECCTLQVALQIFWLADGFTYLQEKEGNLAEPNWTAFMDSLYRNILSGKYKVGKLPFKPELNKVQIYRFKKLLSEEEMIFITPIEGNLHF